MSDWLENKVVDSSLRGQPFPVTSIAYLGVLTAAPNDANGSGTEVIASAAPAGTGYARVKTCAGASQALTDWKSTQGDDLVSTGTTANTKNSLTLTLPAPGNTAWGLCTHWGLWDSPSGGNLLWWGALSAQKNVGAGDAAPVFNPLSISITVDTDS